MKLTIKAIIRWEQLNKKPFSTLDYGNEDDVVSLFYVCRLSNDKPSSLADFKESLKEDDIKKMIQDFEKETSVISQFQYLTTRNTNESESPEESDPVYIKDIVPLLVLNGLDAKFAFSEMEICDLPVFLSAYDTKMKQQFESSRLWAFIQVSPHLPKKIKTPADLYPFSWEMKERKEKATKQLERDAAMFEAFMNSGQIPS